MAIDRYVGPGSGRARQVSAQDRRPSFRIDVLEAHGLAAAMAQHRPATGRPHVAHPVRALAEHRHQVALAFVPGDDYRKRDDAARAPSRNLQRDSATAIDAVLVLTQRSKVTLRGR